MLAAQITGVFLAEQQVALMVRVLVVVLVQILLEQMAVMVVMEFQAVVGEYLAHQAHKQTQVVTAVMV
jgi:hypothetical protein